MKESINHAATRSSYFHTNLPWLYRCDNSSALRSPRIAWKIHFLRRGSLLRRLLRGAWPKIQDLAGPKLTLVALAGQLGAASTGLAHTSHSNGVMLLIMLYVHCTVPVQAEDTLLQRRHWQHLPATAQESAQGRGLTVRSTAQVSPALPCPSERERMASIGSSTPHPRPQTPSGAETHQRTARAHRRQ
jgi:hypothetical protein